MQKLSLEKWKHLISFRQIMFFWYRHYKAMFFVAFLAILALGGFSWYRNVHSYAWSPERKQEFIAEYFKETRFQEERFRTLVDSFQEREKARLAPLAPIRDIFGDPPAKNP